MQGERPEYKHISTGHLPAPEQVQGLVDDAWVRYRGNGEGELSDVYPAMTRVSRDLFGICLVGTSGRVYKAGDTGVDFTIMSVSKPFVFALVCAQLGHRAAREKLGANATGRPFNSLAAVERSPDGRTNPMVNSGAIMTTSLVLGANADEKWRFIHDGLSRFAGRELPLNEEIYASATETNFRNRGMAWLLHSLGHMHSDPLEATDLYTRQCSLNINAHDLALMGATLASGGRNPLTGEQVIARDICHYALATMVTAGMYETSGDWLYETGLPGKSGIGGGIVTVSPGKGGLGTFAPLLDNSGHSIKGQLATRFLATHLGLDLFISDSN